VQDHDLNDLLGKFLKNMLEPQRPQAGPRPPQGPQTPPRPAAPPSRWGEPVPTRPAQRPAAVPPLVPTNAGTTFRGAMVSAEVVEAEPVTGDDVAAHVAEYLNSRRVTEGATHLGERVANADDELSAHQRQLFGSGPRSGLAHSPTAGTASGQTTRVERATDASIVGEVIAGLRTPQDIRLAFVLGEILRRPEWNED
jgi:hypothetical protein